MSEQKENMRIIIKTAPGRKIEKDFVVTLPVDAILKAKVLEEVVVGDDGMAEINVQPISFEPREQMQLCDTKNSQEG